MSNVLVTVPIFEIDVRIFTDREEARAFFRQRCPGEKEPPALVGGTRGCTINNDLIRMLCVFDGGLPIVVHESVHMAWSILQECSVVVNFRNDEPLAYLSSWLVAKFLECLPTPLPQPQQRDEV